MTRAMPVPDQPGARREPASLDLGGLHIITGSKHLPCGPAEPAQAFFLQAPCEPHAKQVGRDPGSGRSIRPLPFFPKHARRHRLDGVQPLIERLAHEPTAIR